MLANQMADTALLQTPADLTLPRTGSTTARRILGTYLKWLTRELLQIPMGRFQAPVFDTFTDARSRLIGLLKTPKAGMVYASLRRPSISVLVRCLHRELWGDGDVKVLDQMLGELGALLWLELALADELPAGGVGLNHAPAVLYWAALGVTIERAADVSLGVREGELVLGNGPSEERVAFGELAAIGDGSEPERCAESVRIKRAHFPLTQGISLVAADNNPLSDQEAHPEKQGNAIDLGTRDASAWSRALGAAFATIELHYPELAEEMRLVMQSYHPVGYDAERHLSASYAEAIGAAYLSLHPDSMTLSEALIHEFCHNKINALFAADQLLENAFEPLFSSPVRPDPRPLYGVLLAVHAFVPVAELYRRMLESGAPASGKPAFRARYEQIVAKNLDGIATLRRHGKPTPTGAWCLAELFAWADAQSKPSVPPELAGAIPD